MPLPEVWQSKLFKDWLLNLRDRTGRAKIVTRILRLARGNPGDVKSVGGGVFELRISFGPGYRVYYTHRGTRFVVLLCGGDKSSQEQDIRRAKKLAQDVQEGEIEPWH